MGNEHSSSASSGGKHGLSHTASDASYAAAAVPSTSQSTPLAAVSQPRYMDESSMVFTVPQFRDATPASVAGNASPLSPNRRPFATPSSFSSPAIPMYNEQAAATEVTSPVLRSYRQHSFTSAQLGDYLCSPVGSQPRVFPGSNPNAMSLTPDRLTPSGSRLSLSQQPSPVAPQPQPGPAPIHERYLEISGHPLGLENFGNTCYCNSVVQLLYHCAPLRLRLLELHEIYASKKGGAGFEETTLLYHLCCLFAVMHRSNNRSLKKTTSGAPPKREMISPKAFLACVRRNNAIFNNMEQQDAHEFAMYVLNDIVETERKMMADPHNRALFLEGKKKKSSSLFGSWKPSSGGSKNKASSGHRRISNSNSQANANTNDETLDSFSEADLSPLQTILQGQFVSLTACLECSTVIDREEPFIDLSVETQQGCSLLNCLHRFGDPEYFYGSNTLHCDVCATQVRAVKTFHVHQLPQYALLMHLKRFRYDPARSTFTKKADHVALSMEMDVDEFECEASGPLTARPAPTATGGAAAEAEAETEAAKKKRLRFREAPEDIKRQLRGVARHKARFMLTGFVAHIGEGANVGHYFTCVRYGPHTWRRFDDDVVTELTEREIEQCYGVPINVTGVVTTTAYILLYERVA